MIKYLLILLFITMFSPRTMAQVNQAEAKAAFLLAEESFASGNWGATFKYLYQCEDLLGTTNSTILYLKLLAQMEVAKEKPEYYSKAINTIAAIESPSIVNDFDEDKLLEIMKIKLQAKELYATFERDQKQKLKTREMYRKGFQVALERDFKNLPLHVSYSELMIGKKDHPYLKKKHNSESDDYFEGCITKFNYQKFSYYGDHEGALAVHVKGDQVHGYRLITTVHYKKKDADAHTTTLVDQYSKEFGFAPHTWNRQYTAALKSNFDVYQWRNGNMIFKLIDSRTLKKNNDNFIEGETILEVFEW